MPTHTLNDLLIHELREMYDAEHELVKILAALGREISDMRTAQLLNSLRCETRNHVFGIEQILSTLGQVPRRVKCRWILGLVEGYEAFLRTKPTPAVLNAYDLSLALKALRAVVSSYRILITLALRLNHPQIVDPLRQNLWDAEGGAERLQSQLGRINSEGPNSWGTTTIALPAPTSQTRPATLPAASQLPPDSPEDRENVLAGGQENG